MEVLREHKDSVMAVLEAFVYDPLLNWRLMDSESQQEPGCWGSPFPQWAWPVHSPAGLHIQSPRPRTQLPHHTSTGQLWWLEINFKYFY